CLAHFREHFDRGEVAVEDPDQAPRLGRASTDRLERLVDLDRVLDVVSFEAMQPETDGLVSVPELRGALEIRVGEVGQLAQDAPVDLEESICARPRCRPRASWAHGTRAPRASSASAPRPPLDPTADQARARTGPPPGTHDPHRACAG